MTLVKGRVELKDGEFIIHKPTLPSFDDYICDLAVMFEAYPSRDKQQRHDARLALKLIDSLEKTADRLPKVPRREQS